MTLAPPARSSVAPSASGPTNPPAYPSVEWTASVAPRRPGSALPALPAVSDEESDQISIAYSNTRAAAPAYGSAALKPITAASAAEVSIVPRMKRRRPSRMASSLPQTLAHTPISPITLATVAGASGVHAPVFWAAKRGHLPRMHAIRDRVRERRSVPEDRPKIEQRTARAGRGHDE